MLVNSTAQSAFRLFQLCFGQIDWLSHFLWGRSDLESTEIWWGVRSAEVPRFFDISDLSKTDSLEMWRGAQSFSVLFESRRRWLQAFWDLLIFLQYLRLPRSPIILHPISLCFSPKMYFFLPLGHWFFYSCNLTLIQFRAIGPKH